MNITTVCHGTLAMYRHHRCRCTQCRNVWNEKTQEYKRKARMKRKIQINRLLTPK